MNQLPTSRKTWEERLAAVNLRAAFLLVLAGTLAVKFLLAGTVALSGDEAYYYIYAKYPALGYKDHPPMIGWILNLFLYLGTSKIVLRLPAILFSAAVGPGIYLLLREYDERKAYLVAIMYLLSPLNLLYVIVTTDVPLYLFSFLSASCLFRAMKGERLRDYALSGAFLGCAFLSKYFAVLLGLSYAVAFLLTWKESDRSRGFLLLFLSALPFVALNVAWNYTHAWDNIMFNLMNRNQGEAFSLKKIGVNVLTQLYLVTPPVVFLLARGRRGLVDRIRRSPLRVFAFFFAVPVAVFTLMSPWKNIGLHWALSFYPFLFVVLFAALETGGIARGIRGMGIFTGAQVAILGILLALPVGAWKNTGFYDDFVFMFRNDRIAGSLNPYGNEYRFATTSFSQSAMLSFHSGRYFSVFGRGSHNGRQDDLLTDFRTFDGGNILVFSKGEAKEAEYAPYFRSVEVRKVAVEGAVFPVVLGKGFRFTKYRDEVLRDIRALYYDIPPFLPPTRNYFAERYFGPQAAQARTEVDRRTRVE